MGGGSYSYTDRNIRATNMGYFTKSHEEIFESKKIDNSMNPEGVTLRESRDSEEHPESLAIIIGLDETGSMYEIPHYLVKDGLPSTINNIFKHGIEHPQVMFFGIGDHKVDAAPFQVGQFESSDELLDQWLTRIYLEGHGGGNGGESYHLAWYFAALRTEIDCLEKRSQKGVLITVGDEPVHSTLSSGSQTRIFGHGDYRDWTTKALLSKASKKYHVYHINVEETMNGSSKSVQDGWKELLGENFISLKSQTDIAETIANLVAKSIKTVSVQETSKDQEVIL
jgi:hypothetical protein